MLIIGCDYHPGFEQIAFMDSDSGEFQEQRLAHREEAEKFYRNLAAQGVKVRVGKIIEAEQFGELAGIDAVLSPRTDANENDKDRHCASAIPIEFLRRLRPK